MNIYWFFILLINSSVFSCTPKELNSDQLVEFLGDPKNKVAHQVELNNVNFRISYCPPDLLFQGKVPDNLDNIYFNIKVSKQNLSLPSFFFKEINLNPIFRDKYYFEFNENFILIGSNGDTLKAIEVVHNRASLDKNQSDFILIFSNKNKIFKSDSFEIVFLDFGLGIGNQIFRYNVDDIKYLPALLI